MLTTLKNASEYTGPLSMQALDSYPYDGEVLSEFNEKTVSLPLIHPASKCIMLFTEFCSKEYFSKDGMCLEY